MPICVAAHRDISFSSHLNDDRPAMKIPGVLPLLLFLVLLAMLPFVFGQLFTSALIKLKLEPTAALLVVIGIFLGSAINL
jgi:uncharacterized membrane protein